VRQLKKVVIKHQGHQCSICQETEWLGLKIPIVLDPIDGDHTNNKLSNLRLVCPNCDAQLPTYKSKNMGKGRKDRTLAYYKERFKN
jgi:5-methylcytosine-specific restriction endonuclease McrA